MASAEGLGRVGLLVVLLLVPLAVAGGQDASGGNELDLAFERFLVADPELQHGLLADVQARLENHDDPGVQALLERVQRARKELDLRPAEPLTFFDPQVYAGGLVTRNFLDVADPRAKKIRVRYPHWAHPPFHARVTYDDGDNVGREQPDPLRAQDQLENLMFGYPPGADVLLAWTEKQLDHDKTLDNLGRHFRRAYCDLQADCYPGVSMWDAFSAPGERDMPDVDAIAFAREVLHKRSYRSPLPPDERRAALYQEITDAFERYYKERTFREAFALLTVNPGAELRPEHENLRNKVLYSLLLDEQDFGKIRRRLRSDQDRAGFIEHIDGIIRKDPGWERKIKRSVAAHNEVRWLVAEAAFAVLGEYGLLRD